jgi:hypothetical protein
MKILVCGTSVVMPDLSSSWSPRTWIHYLQTKLGCEVVNISRAGCGNQYMHDAVLAEVTERQYDLVLVSWNIADRIEFRTQYKLPMPDWKNMINPHQEYMQTDWIFPHTLDDTMPFEDAATNKNELFKSRFATLPKYETNHQIMLTHILSLQSTLKSYGVPYTFVFYRTLLQLKRFKSYYDKIDWNYIHPDSLFRQAKNMKMWDPKTLHPTEEAYMWYADEMYKFLNDRNLIKP